MKSAFGIIGMGVMGKSLAINLAGKNVPVSIFNRHVAGSEESIAENIRLQHAHLPLQAFDDLRAFVDSLESPRKILLMIIASAVDQQLETLVPQLSPGDVVIDGGNSHFSDTEKRIQQLQQQQLAFLGVGISGGEEGALTGPAIMPGGPSEGYQITKNYFDLLAAKDFQGQPCTGYIGPGGSGHFVKMVHNGIEYAEMQLIAEVYDILRHLLDKTPEEIIEIFQLWSAEGSGSFLLDVTMKILSKKLDGELLLDKILDAAEQKGTGRWSAEVALEMAVPYSSLTEAVMARYISARKEERKKLSEKIEIRKRVSKPINIEALKHSYNTTRLINHHIGFDLIKNASEKYGWNVQPGELARIWTNGCIIKSPLMEKLSAVLRQDSSILDSASAGEYFMEHAQFAEVVSQTLSAGTAIPVLSSALNYFLGMHTEQSPANLIQAMRDYFGAHTYRRTDAPPDQYFHTEW